MTRIKFLFLSLFSAVSFYVFSRLVKRDYFKSADFDLTIKLQDQIALSLDSYFSYISFLASFEIIIAFLVVLVVFLTLKRKYLSFLLIPIIGMGHFVELYGKTLIDHRAPPLNLLRGQDTSLFPEWYAHPVSSFPSGHSMRAVFVGLILFFLVFRLQKLSVRTKLFLNIFVVVFVVSVCVSKILLGQHWTTDVVGGALLGATLAFFSLALI